MAEEYASSTAEELREAIIGLVQAVVETLSGVSLENAGATVVQEAIRAAGEAGLSYRAACKLRSRTEFYEALPRVSGHVDATLYWLSLALDCSLLPPHVLAPLIKQTRETTAKLSAARLSAARRLRDE